MKRFKLVGLKTDGTVAQYGNEVHHFTNDTSYFKASVIADGKLLELITPKGTYTLEKHTTANRYQGICNGRKVHVTLKKVVGQVLYW